MAKHQFNVFCAARHIFSFSAKQIVTFQRWDAIIGGILLVSGVCLSFSSSPHSYLPETQTSHGLEFLAVAKKICQICLDYLTLCRHMHKCVLLPVTFQHSLVLQIIVHIALDWIESHTDVRQQRQQFCQFTLHKAFLSIRSFLRTLCVFTVPSFVESPLSKCLSLCPLCDGNKKSALYLSTFCSLHIYLSQRKEGDDPTRAGLRHISYSQSQPFCLSTINVPGVLFRCK